MTWTPNQQQKEFFDIPPTVTQALFEGEGKTEAIIRWPLWHGYTNCSDFHGLLYHPSYEYLDRVIRPRAMETYKGFTYSDSRRVFTSIKGARIFLACDSVEYLLSCEFQYMGLDNLQDISENEYSKLMIRLRSSNPNLRPVLRASISRSTWIDRKFCNSA